MFLTDRNAFPTIRNDIFIHSGTKINPVQIQIYILVNLTTKSVTNIAVTCAAGEFQVRIQWHPTLGCCLTPSG